MTNLLLQKKTNLFALSVVLILIALTVCASFLDYEIASAVYLGQQPSENIFGIIFSFIGIIPTFVGWSFLGASILALSKRQIESKKLRGWLTSLAMLLFVLSFFFFCNTLMMVNDSAFSVHWAIAYPIGILVIVFVAILGYKLSINSTNTHLIKVVLELTIISLVTMIVIMGTKNIMNRPRFRFVLDSNNVDYFRNWWQSGKDIKQSLELATVTDEFSSFPSGHSAYSMFAIFLFPALSCFIKKLEKCKTLLFCLGFLWWGLTAFSRLTVGAHYLSDVSIAGLVTIFSYGIVKLILKIISNKKSSV